MELGAVFLFCFVTPAHHMYKHLAFWLNTARLDHSRRFSVWFVLVMNVLLLAMCRNMLSTELKTSRFQQNYAGTYQNCLNILTTCCDLASFRLLCCIFVIRSIPFQVVAAKDPNDMTERSAFFLLLYLGNYAPNNVSVTGLKFYIRTEDKIRVAQSASLVSRRFTLTGRPKDTQTLVFYIYYLLFFYIYYWET